MRASSISRPSALLLLTGCAIAAGLLHCVGDDPVTGGPTPDGGGGGDAIATTDTGSSGGGDAGDSGDPPPASAGDHQWSKVFSGASGFAFGVSVDGAGNSYVVGQFDGTGVDFEATKLTASGSDGFVLKLDPAGKVLWAQQLTGTATAGEGVAGVATDSAGFVYITGFFSGATATIGGQSLTGVGIGTGFVAKLRQSDGVAEWARTIGGDLGGIRCRSIAFAAGKLGLACDGAVNTITMPGLPPESRGDANVYGSDIFIARLDPATGSAEWVNRIGGLTQVADGGSFGFDRSSGVAVEPSGDVLFCGQIGSLTITDSKASISLGKVGNAPGTNAIVARLAGVSGKQLWTRLYGSATNTGTAVAHGLSADAKSVYVAGGFLGAVDFRKQTMAALGGSDAYVLGLDVATGETTWQHRIGGTSVVQNEFAQSIAVDRWGRVIVAGQHASADTSVDTSKLDGILPTSNAVSAGPSAFFAVKLGSDGSVLYKKSLASASTSDAIGPTGAAFAQDGSIRFTGYLQGTLAFDKIPVSSLAPTTASPFVLSWTP